MKRIKYFWLFFIAIALSNCSACANNENNSINPSSMKELIVGKWRFSGLSKIDKEKAKKMEVLLLAMYGGIKEQNYYFSNDGKIELVIKGTKTISGANYTEEHKGTYEITDKGSLIMTFDDNFEKTMQVNTVSNEKLVLKPKEYNDEFPVYEEYIKE